MGAETLAQGVECLLHQKRRVHQLTYSALVKHTECELRCICNFASLSFDPDMVDLQAADHSILPHGQHHDHVRSGVIRRQTTSEDLPPLQFHSKGLRYANAWREKFTDLEFSDILVSDSSDGKPSLMETTMDRLANRGWLIVDILKTQIFRKIPLPLWDRIRMQSSRTQQAGETAFVARMQRQERTSQEISPHLLSKVTNSPFPKCQYRQ